MRVTRATAVVVFLFYLFLWVLAINGVSSLVPVLAVPLVIGVLVAFGVWLNRFMGITPRAQHFQEPSATSTTPASTTPASTTPPTPTVPMVPTDSSDIDPPVAAPDPVVESTPKGSREDAARHDASVHDAARASEGDHDAASRDRDDAPR